MCARDRSKPVHADVWLKWLILINNATRIDCRFVVVNWYEWINVYYMYAGF